MICTLSHPCTSPDLAGVDRWKRKGIGRGGKGQKWNYAKWTINLLLHRNPALLWCPELRLIMQLEWGVLRAFSSVLFHKTSWIPFIWRELVLSWTVTLPAETTWVSVYMRKKLTPPPELTALAHALIVSPWLNCMEKKLTRQGGWPYHHKRVTQLGGSPF